MQISDAEWKVMNVVWESQPVDARFVIDQVASENDWSAATVKTMLHRLVRKGALAHEASGKRYLYRAVVRRADCVRQASRTFLDRVFGGQAAPALLQFVKMAKLSAEEVESLRVLLDSKEPKE